MRRFGNEDTHYYANEHMLPLAEELVRVAPAGMTRVDIALNGTEAVETAIRFMRRATGRPDRDRVHGRLPRRGGHRRRDRRGDVATSRSGTAR